MCVFFRFLPLNQVYHLIPIKKTGNSQATNHTLNFCFLLILLCGDIELCPGPRNKKGIHIAHQNICGLFSKRDDVADFYQSKQCQYFWSYRNTFNNNVLKLGRHENKICCNRMKMLRCVPMLNLMRSQHFWPNDFVSETKRIFKSI